MARNEISPSEQYIRGRDALSEGDQDLARELIGTAVSRNPGNAGWRISLGSLLLNSGKSIQALEQFDAASGLGPDSAKLQVFRARALSQEGMYLDAWRAFLRAVELEPDSVAAWLALGKYAYERRDLDSATTAYEAVLKEDPEHLSAHATLAAIAATREDAEAEVRHRIAVADLKPDHIPSQMLAGSSLIGANRLREARERYLRVATLQPDHAGASAVAEELDRWMQDGVPTAGVVSVEYYNAVYRNSSNYQLDGAELGEAEHFEVICDLLRNDDATMVLDIGCGPGQFAQYLRSRSTVPYIGIDYSSVAIEKALERSIAGAEFELIDVVAGDLPDIPAGTSIVCTEVLEHILDDLELIRRFPAGSHCYCSVPSFHTFGHLRHFVEARDVQARYGEFFDGFHIMEIPIGSGANRLYVFGGVRNGSA